jgi:hypothetical protein
MPGIHGIDALERNLSRRRAMRSETVGLPACEGGRGVTLPDRKRDSLLLRFTMASRQLDHNLLNFFIEVELDACEQTAEHVAGCLRVS